MSEGAGTSVGVITLDLRILNTIQEQIENIASKAQQNTEKSFAKIGEAAGKTMQEPVKRASETMEKAITAPVEKAQKVVQDTLEKTESQTDDTISRIDAIIARHQQEAKEALEQSIKLPQSVPLPKVASATATQIRKQQGKDIDTSGHAANAPPDLSDTFLPASGAADLLQQKLDHINAQFDAERQKLAGLNAEFSKLSTSDKAWDVLSAKIEASEQKLISLRESMLSTQAKIDEPAKKAAAAAEKAAEAQKKAQDKAAAAAEKAAQRAAQAQEKAAERASQSVQQESSRSSSAFSAMGDGVGKTATRLGRSIRSALNSTFIMAGLYAVFKGMRTLMGEAAEQNKQFASSLNAIKANLAIAFTPIMQSIMPALNALMSGLATVTQAIAVFISSIFGKTYAQSLAATKQMQKTAADAKKTSAASGPDRSVASFEEIHVISKKQDSGGSADSAGGINYDALNAKGSNAANLLADKFKAAFAAINTALAPTKQALSGLWGEFQRLGGFVWKGLVDFYNSFLVPVGKWTLGTGLPGFINAVRDGMAKTDWGKINNSLHGLWTALTPFAIHVGEGLLWFWKNVMVPLGTWTMNNVVPKFIDILSGAIKTADKTIAALKPTGQWLFDNFLKPLAAWTGGVIVNVLDSISGSLNKVSSWISSNQGAVQGMTVTVGAFFAAWEVTKVLSFIGQAGGVVGALKQIKEAVAGATLAKMKDNIETAKLTLMYAKDFVVAMGKGTLEIGKQIIQWGILTAAKVGDAIKTGIQTVATNAAAVAQAALNLVMSLNPIALIVIAIAALVAAFVILWNNCEGFRNFWIGLWNGIVSICQSIGAWFAGPFVDFFKNAWNGIKGAFSAVGNWFRSVFSSAWSGITNIWNGARNFFSGVWNGITGVFSSVGSWFGNIFRNAYNGITNAFSGIRNFFNGVWNGMTGGLKGAINSIIRGINSMINGLNRIHIDMPDWMGGGSFGINIPTIPYLAKGGIIDKPTLSMIGEAGREAVVPLENNTGGLQELATKLFALMGGAGGGIDYDRLYDVIVRALRDSKLGIVLYNGNYDLLAQGMLKAMKGYQSSHNVPQTM